MNGRRFTARSRFLLLSHICLNRYEDYVDDMARTNGIESMWAVLKRGYNGAYHNSSTKHLHYVPLIKPYLQWGK